VLPGPAGGRAADRAAGARGRPGFPPDVDVLIPRRPRPRLELTRCYVTSPSLRARCCQVLGPRGKSARPPGGRSALHVLIPGPGCHPHQLRVITPAALGGAPRSPAGGRAAERAAGARGRPGFPPDVDVLALSSQAWPWTLPAAASVGTLSARCSQVPRGTNANRAHSANYSRHIQRTATHATYPRHIPLQSRAHTYTTTTPLPRQSMQPHNMEKCLDTDGPGPATNSKHFSVCDWGDSGGAGALVLMSVCMSRQNRVASVPPATTPAGLERDAGSKKKWQRCHTPKIACVVRGRGCRAWLA
jgi:hypothetical protein